MCDASLVAALRNEAFELGRMTVSPTNFPGDQEKKAGHINEMEREVMLRLTVPVIV